jgi:hypothetical protein
LGLTIIRTFAIAGLRARPATGAQEAARSIRARRPPDRPVWAGSRQNVPTPFGDDFAIQEAQFAADYRHDFAAKLGRFHVHFPHWHLSTVAGETQEVAWQNTQGTVVCTHSQRQ